MVEKSNKELQQEFYENNNWKLFENKKHIFLDMDGTITLFQKENNMVVTDKNDFVRLFSLGYPITLNIDVVKFWVEKTGAKIHIMSHSPDDASTEAKKAWIKKYVPEIEFESMMFPTWSKEDKGDVIVEWCRKNNESLKDVILIDDNISVLQEVEKKGIDVYHAVNLVRDAHELQIWKNKDLTFSNKDETKNPKEFTDLQRLLDLIFDVNLEVHQIKDREELRTKNHNGSDTVAWRWFDDENVYLTKEIIDEWFVNPISAWADFKKTYIPCENESIPSYAVPLSNEILINSLLLSELDFLDSLVIDGDLHEEQYLRIKKAINSHFTKSKKQSIML